MRGYEEEVKTKVIGMQIGENGLEQVEINVGLDGQESIKTILPQIAKKYEDQVIVQQNTMYYKYNNTKDSKERAKWCFETGIPVWGYDNMEDIENKEQEQSKEPASKGEYTKVGNTYCCAPDLTGFNVDHTYYVTYDGDKEIIGDRVNKPVPENWYNYGEKKWANIVTINGEEMAYFTWIPRYVYLIDSEAKSAQSPKVKFVDKTGKYKDGITNQEATYTDKTITLDGSGVQTNYVLPEAFTFGTTELAGYWVSKYEISNTPGMSFEIRPKETSIEIKKANIASVSGADSATYDFFLNGKLINTGKLPYEYTGLKSNTEYEIKIICRDSSQKVIGAKIGTEKTLKSTTTEVTKPDLTGFNPNNTYYVTYDGDKDIIGDSISKAAPNDWYDYENKKWANIVTINGNEMAFFTWIPRYEYRTDYITQNIETRFISVEQTKPTTGFKIPEAFKFGEKDLKGYWMSKYEISSGTEISFNTFIKDTSIKFDNVNSTNISDISNATYEFYLNGTLITTTSTFPFEYTGLSPNTEYDIKVIIRDSTGKIIGAKVDMIKTLEKNISELTKPDLTGFNPEKTFYVTYDDSGNETNIVPISQTAPDNWYNYEEKKWANIVTKNGDEMAYFTWIPRYEYKTNNLTQNIELRFIASTQTTATRGYKLPEAFTFANKNLSGYWVSKYEISQ